MADADAAATETAVLDSSYDFSIVQPDDHEYDGETDIRFSGSSNDLSLLQNVSASTTTRGNEGKGRLDSLKENLHKQQERLTALKERALRKSQDGRHKSSMSDSMESLRNLGQKLTVLKTRAGSLALDSSTPLVTPTKEDPRSAEVSLIQTSGSEKLQMLTQRTEQNRALLEQRKRDLAKSLLSVKTSSMSTATELGSSMTDLRQASASAANPAPVSRHRSALDLEAQGQEATDEGRLKLLKNRMKITELKQSRQEQEMQEMRTELARRGNLIEQLELSGAELQRLLTQQNEKLEQLRLAKGQEEEKEKKEKERTEKDEVEKKEEEDSLQEQEITRLQGEVTTLRERLAELENVNDILETTRCELQDELTTIRERERERLEEQEQKLTLSESTAATTDAQVSQELAKQLHDLTNQLAELQEANEKLRQSKSELPVSDASVSERLAELEAKLEEQTAAMAAQSEELAEKTTELNVLNVNLRVLEEKLAQSSRNKPLFLDDALEDSGASKELQEELQQLKQKLDESNKANIKLKLKCKQAEKQLQKLQTQDGQQQLATLQAENEELQQRITVLEDEKGQWQLSKMQEDEDTDQASPPEANPLQLEAIRLLEEQKLELQQALEALQQGHESARVESELSEAQLEEQLTQRVQQLEQEAQEQRQQLDTLQSEKETLDKKLSHYISENMELLDKLEKLSSSSSAESIEIVERQQLEDPPVPRHVSELTQTDQAEDGESGESVAQLRERLELFTQERGEVLDKLEQLTAENNQLQARLEELNREREKELHSSTSTASTTSNLSQELTSMQRSTEVVAALDAGDGGPVLFEKCEKSLNKLNSELEAYRKANDRQAKFNVAKKLAREAKHCHAQLSELLAKVKEASSAVETVTVVETVVAVTAPNGKALAEYEQLTAQNAELKAEISRLRLEIEELRESYPEVEPQLAIGAAQKDEEELLQLQSLLEDSRNLQTELRQQIDEQLEIIRELRQTEADHLQLVAKQSAEITQLQLRVEQFDQLLDSKEMSHEKQLEQQTRIRRELEARSESLEGELSILQALVAEQKQQLIENLSESEHALNLKMLELQSAREEIQELRGKTGDEDPEQLREALRISKNLAAQQISELASRQDTIDALNQQVQELYQGVEQTRQEEQQKSRDLKEKLKKYALNLKKRGQENADLEQQLQDLRKQLEEKQQEAEVQKPQEDNQEQVEQLQQQVAKLNEELKAKIHLNLENRDALRQLKQQLQEQELVNKELRRERQEADEEIFQMGQESSQRKEETAKLKQELSRLHKELEQRKKDLEQLAEQQPALEDLRRQLESKSTKFDKSKELIKHRNATIQALQKELQQLRQNPPGQDEQAGQLEQLRQEKDSEIAALRQQILQLEDSQRISEAGIGDGAFTKTTVQPLDAAPNPEVSLLEAAKEEQEHLRTQLQAAQEQYALLASQYAREKADFEVNNARQETLHEGIQAKLQEDASYIESLESQVAELQARSAALEDQAARQANQQAAEEDRRQILEQELQQQREQDEQLQEQDLQLQERLRELSDKEQAYVLQLQMSGTETEDLREQLRRLRAEYDSLAAKHDQVTAAAQAEREQLSSHSQEELADLHQQLQAKEADLQRQRQVYDAKLAAKVTELDELECDLNNHVERATQESRDLLQQLERAQEQLGQRGEELQRLSDEFQEVERERSTLSREVTLLRLQQDGAEQDVLELQELRMQAIQDKTEMDNLRTQIDALCANHSQELQALQQQIAEMDTLGQNQTDDQVYFETENKRLAEQLSELQAQLARQQQAPITGSIPAPIPAPISVPTLGNPPPASLFFGGDPSPFDEIVPQPLRIGSQAAPLPPADLHPPPTIEDLQRNVSDLEKHAQDLENKLLARNQSLAELEEHRKQTEQRLAELERALQEREQQLAEIRREKEEQERLAQLEKLIQPAAAAAPTLDMFFGGEHVPDIVSHQLDFGLPQTEAVVEPLIVPRKAYVCQPEQEATQVIDFGVDDDPWANAATEEPQTDVEPLRNRIAQLEQQLATAEQQKTELQTKAAKLMKRLKEYKTKATTVAAPSVSVDNDLDSAIIDELKNQLQLQESRQAKAEEQLQQHLLEKEKLTKRIDVLTAGNERMAELKERQDMDVQMYQARIRELQEKLNQLDQWDVPASAPPAVAVAAAVSPLSENAAARLESLQTENQDLNTECQELQEKLKEERRLVQMAEDTAARAQSEKEQLQEELRVRLQEVEELRQVQASPQDSELLQKLQVEKEQLLTEVTQLRSLQAEVDQLRSLKAQQDQALEGHRIQDAQREEYFKGLQAEVEHLRSAKLEQEQLQGQQQQQELRIEQEQLSHLQREVEQLRELQTEVIALRGLQPELEDLRSLKLQQEHALFELNSELDALRQRASIGESFARDPSEDQSVVLQEKESEILHLKQRIEELMREDQTEKLVFEILTKNQELQLLRLQVKQLEEEREDLASAAVVPEPAAPAPVPSEALAELEQLLREKADMEEELRVLNNHVLGSLELEDKMKQTLLQLDTKDIEITELRRSLEVLQSQQSQPSQPAPADLAAINQQWEQVVEQKCSEVASIWQEHLNQREAAFQAQLAEISQQHEKEILSSAVPAAAATEPSSELMAKMQKALETQEMEIVTLKEQLAIRSAEYARLAAQYDPFRLQNRGGASGGPATAGGPPSLAGNEALPEYVLKADLDYALMMLHQRDMRVEEMILELVQLLEERDHLQLKLSDTLRQLETERSRTSDEPASATTSSSAASGSSPSKTSSAGSSSEILGGVTPNSTGSDLKQKLAELQTVKHSKDKAIVDEREQRLQQMLQLQRDMAKGAASSSSGAAPAPASSSAPALDLSQPALRSPSMMLMDWILGNNKSEEEPTAPGDGHGLGPAPTTAPAPGPAPAPAPASASFSSSG
nr:protein lava lamp [Drosophila bipectinata]